MLGKGSFDEDDGLRVSAFTCIDTGKDSTTVQVGSNVSDILGIEV